jgi:glycine cleavage system H protein
MNVPNDLRYLKTHEWVRIEGGKATVGVTEYAVEQLNRDIVFVELPAADTQVRQGQPFGVIEAVKAVYDLYAPVSGRVVEVNQAVADDPAIVGQSPFDQGWMIRIEMLEANEVNSLLDSRQYRSQLTTEDTEH